MNLKKSAFYFQIHNWEVYDKKHKDPLVLDSCKEEIQKWNLFFINHIIYIK